MGESGQVEMVAEFHYPAGERDGILHNSGIYIESLSESTYIYIKRVPDAVSAGKNGMPSYARAQMFKFKWYTSTKCGGKTIKNCWKLVCRENNICFCAGGWSTLETMQTNWSTDY